MMKKGCMPAVPGVRDDTGGRIQPFLSYLCMDMSVESILGGEMTFELKDNGKCVLNVAGDEETGKWSENEDGFNVEDQFDFKVDGDVATMDYSGVTITLEKQ